MDPEKLKKVQDRVGHYLDTTEKLISVIPEDKGFTTREVALICSVLKMALLNGDMVEAQRVDNMAMVIVKLGDSDGA